MRLSSFRHGVWRRLVSRLLARSRSRVPARKPAVSLWAFEDRITPGSVLDALGGGAAFGGPGFPPAAAEASFLPPPERRPTATLEHDYVLPPNWAVSLAIAADGARESAAESAGRTRSPLDELDDLGPTRTGSGSDWPDEFHGAGTGSLPPSADAPQPGSTFGGGIGGAETAQAPAAARPDPAGGIGFGPSAARITVSGPADSARPGGWQPYAGPTVTPGDAAAGRAGLDRFGLISHQPLQSGTSRVTSTRQLAPTSPLADAFRADRHATRRPDSAYAGADVNHRTAAAPLHAGRPTKANPTGVTGSVSPRAVLDGRVAGRASSPSARLDALTADSMTAGTNPAIDGPRSLRGVRAAAADAPASSPSATFGPSAAPASGPSPTGGGAGTGSSPVPGTTTTGGGRTVVRDDGLAGDFTFAHTLSGTDAQGPYTVTETGVGKFRGGDPSRPTDGTVAVTSRLQRGAQPAGPAATETVAFSPAGTGLVFGFDLDAYTAGKFGVTVSAASKYSVTGGGTDAFTTNDADTVVSSVPAQGRTETDAVTTAGGGTQAFSLTVGGTGASRTYTTGATSSSTFGTTEDDQTAVATAADQTAEHYHDAGSGGETLTYTESGTVGADGTVAMSSFALDDSVTSSDSSSDSGTDGHVDPGDTESDAYGSTSTGASTEHVVVGGTATDWTATLDETEDDDVTAADNGQDHPHATAGDGTSSHDDQTWTDSAGGHVHDAVHVAAGGHGTAVTVTGVTLTLSGTSKYDDGVTDASGTSRGADSSNETLTTTGKGLDAFGITETSTDGVAFTVASKESIQNAYTDHDVGGDGWSDPYSGSAGVGGTEGGGDQFDDGDSGDETITVTSTGTLTSSPPTSPPPTSPPMTPPPSSPPPPTSPPPGGSAPSGAPPGGSAPTSPPMTPPPTSPPPSSPPPGGTAPANLSVTVTITGVATAGGKDSGNDLVTVPGASAGQTYADLSATTNKYTIALTNAGGPTTSVSVTSKITGTFTSGTTENDAASGKEVLTEADARTASSTPTIVSVQGGSIAADGKFTPGASSVFIDLPNGAFGTTSKLTDDLVANGTTSNAKQTAGTSGTVGSRVRIDAAADGGVTIDDEERIAEQYNMTANLKQVGVSQSEADFVQLGGPVNAHVHNTGHTTPAGFKSDPGTGDDDVQLGGSYQFTTTQTLASKDYGIILPPVEAYATPKTVTQTTVLSNANFSEKEDDAEVAGKWTPKHVSLQDHPLVTVTLLSTFDGGTLYVESPAIAGTVTGTFTRVTKETLDLDESGTGVSVGGTRTTYHEVVEDRKLAWTSPFYLGTSTIHTKESVKHVVTGSAKPDGSFVDADTETRHGEEDSETNSTVYAHSYTAHTTDTSRGGVSDTKAFTRDDEVRTFTATRQAGQATGVGAQTGASGGGERRVGDGWGEAFGPRGLVNTTRTFGAKAGGGPGETVGDAWTIGWSKDLSKEVVSATDGVMTTRAFGRDPETGAAVDSKYDSTTGPPIQHEPGDWFEQLSNFGAGMGDAVSGGLTKRVRVGLGYDDAVNYQSGAYAVGTAAGTAVSVATVLVNPCAVGGLAGNALRGLNAVNGVASGLDAGEAFGKGDAVAGMMALAGARAGFSSMLKACFAAGTPVRTPGGSTPIDALVPGDVVLSRDEFDAGAPVAARRVVRAFARVSPVVEVLVEGRAVVTTGEHPFWVAGTGWTPAGALAAGDTLVSHDGQELPVTAVRDAGRVESVYNVEVEHDHTYFVGDAAWGFSLWAHNTCVYISTSGGIVNYVGITDNFVARATSHLRKKAIVITTIPGLGSLSRSESLWGKLLPVRLGEPSRHDSDEGHLHHRLAARQRVLVVPVQPPPPAQPPERPLHDPPPVRHFEPDRTLPPRHDRHRHVVQHPAERHPQAPVRRVRPQVRQPVPARRPRLGHRRPRPLYRPVRPPV